MIDRDAYDQLIASYYAHLEWFDGEKTLLGQLVRGCKILDWECGSGAFSEALLRRGAAEVVAIDSWYRPSFSPEEAAIKPTKIDISTFADQPGNAQSFDLQRLALNRNRYAVPI
jgi:2-polyprenyl-3-methyl-5-hydroxy-6-metoxy-1,4-benzoquinol methylase